MKSLNVLFLTLLVCCAGTAMAATPTFTIVAYPDSQNNVGQLGSEVNWTINNRVGYNIVYATQEGDITSAGGAGDFQTAANALYQLDNLMTWGTVPGNHDYYNIANYTTYFGPSHFAGKSWYGGSYQQSSWVTFQGGGRTFIGLQIQNGAASDVLTWAQGVLTTHPANPVVLTTHDYLSDGTQARTSYGNTLWNNLVKSNNQIFMVLAGHMHASGGNDDGEWNQTSTNNAGQPVFELLADYQDRNNGMMRVMTLDEDASLIRVKTYIAGSGTWETDARSQFNLSMNFAERLVPEPASAALLSFAAVTLVIRRRRERRRSE